MINSDVYICVNLYTNVRVSVYCKCTACVQAELCLYLCVCFSVGTYLLAVGLRPDELEARNALLGAHNPDIF